MAQDVVVSTEARISAFWIGKEPKVPGMKVRTRVRIGLTLGTGAPESFTANMPAEALGAWLLEFLRVLNVHSTAMVSGERVLVHYGGEGEVVALSTLDGKQRIDATVTP